MPTWSYYISRKVREEMRQKQNNCCAICNQQFGATPTSRICVDHNHVTDNVRGLLCDRCNRGLGFFLESIESLKAAIDYLEYYRLHEQPPTRRTRAEYVEEMRKPEVRKQTGEQTRLRMKEAAVLKGVKFGRPVNSINSTNRIRHERILRGWSQKALGDRTLISQHAISKLELGQRLPTKFESEQLMKLFEITVSDLLSPAS